MRLSNTLDVEPASAGMQVSCAGCRHLLGRAGDNWKQGAVLSESLAQELEGPYRTGRNLLLRQFSCPQCGALLDTEMALPGEPWLDDRLFVPGN